MTPDPHAQAGSRSGDLLPLAKELAALLAEKQRRLADNKFKLYEKSYSPAFVSDFEGSVGQVDGYHRHREFICSVKRVMALLGGNRVGKTKSAAYALTCHLTGRYPAWWAGKKFYKPIRAWAAGVTARSTRDVIQVELLGPDSDNMGGGMIPKNLIVGKARKLSGVPDGIDTFYVKHISGGISSCTLKSMEQGRAKFQAEEIDVGWLDEEPDKSSESYDIFSELRMRTMTTGGIILLTFTPLKGMNELCQYILDEEHREHVEFVNVTWDDAPHLDPKTKADMEAQMLPHEIEARKLGKPVIKEGLIFPFPESLITCQPLGVIPAHWHYLIGMDVSAYSGTTAAILMVRDPTSQVIYWIAEYANERALREEHAEKILEWGQGIYTQMDTSSNQSEVDGSTTKRAYKAEGMNVHTKRYLVDPGLVRMYEAFKTGKLKIYSTLRKTLEQIRFYQFVNGKPKKVKDHLIDAGRYGFEAIDNARPLAYFKTDFVKKGMKHHGKSDYQPGSSVGY